MELPRTQATKSMYPVLPQPRVHGQTYGCALSKTPGWGEEGANSWKVGDGKQLTLSKRHRRRKEPSSETKKRVGKSWGPDSLSWLVQVQG